MEKCKVLIVGSGASGLYAAYCLVNQKLTSDIIILEAEDRIGGRIHTVPFNDHCIDLGAQWIHGGGDNPLWKFVKENNISLAEKANRDCEGIFIRTDGHSVPLEILEETMDYLWSVHEEANKFSRDPDTSVVIPQSMGHYFDQKFQNWLENDKKSDNEETKLWRRQLFNWFIKFEECDTGCDSFYQHSCISWGEYLDYGDDASFANGYKSVLDKMIAKLGNDVQINLNHRVTAIDYNDDLIKVQTANGKTFQADHVISTMSLGVLKKYHESIFNPRLPSDLITAIENISFGAIDRIKLDFAEPFWDLNDPGLLIVQTDDKLISDISRSNWFKHIFTFDEVNYHKNSLMGWISGDAARFMETLTNEDIAQDVTDYLQEIMRKYKDNPDWELPKLRQIVVTRWNSNPNFCGVYSYRNQDSDAKGIVNKDLSVPVYVRGYPRLLFAGEATDAEHYGTVHGAMSAAAREVSRLEAFWKNNQCSN